MRGIRWCANLDSGKARYPPPWPATMGGVSPSNFPVFFKKGKAMKFRKKPVVIDATQWFKMGDHESVTSFENGCGWVDTLEGGHVVTPGDWIITGVKGEHYPCKPDIFDMTYERV